MPDVDDQIEDDETNEDSSVIRELRKKAKRADEAEAKASALAKENALLKTPGLNLDDEKRAAFLQLLPDDADQDAIVAKATSLGWYEAPAEAPQVPADEQQALQRVQEATAAAQPADGTPEKLEDRFAKAESVDEIRRIAQDAGIGWNDHEI